MTKITIELFADAFRLALAKAAQDFAYLTYAYNIRYSADLDSMFGPDSYGQDYGA